MAWSPFRWAQKLSRWLVEPRHAVVYWFGRWSVVAAWLGLVLAVVTPPSGFGVSLCWFQSATGIPCPGCGMTRSLSCAIRGMPFDSWRYHPMGALVLVLFVVTAAQSILPEGLKSALKRFIQSRARWFNGLYLAFVIAFVGFGAARALVYIGAACIR